MDFQAFHLVTGLQYRIREAKHRNDTEAFQHYSEALKCIERVYAKELAEKLSAALMTLHDLGLLVLLLAPGMLAAVLLRHLRLWRLGRVLQ